ncbi:rRNA methyltransferase [Reticulibacter mediterranei]|uniref:rRNA methyltransferase n=1 Tax=Reticulibacter mediterranei TaxID=2778369 RepID=A0A8J3N4U4_9CHLR|nr:RNA methyltransferase [Reticulibacter mediterranei]GHO94442.1 rRNA methyltransferase [Reticulibacter mediterranei]
MTSSATSHARSRHVSARSNQQHARLQRIYALRTREERQRTGLYYVEGLRFVAHAVQHHIPLETLVVCHSLLDHPFAYRLVQQQKQLGTPVVEVPAAVFRDLSRVLEPQGIGAVVRQRWESLEEIRPDAELCWLALQTVNSPGNLGTMLRTSEAVGGAGVVLLDNSIDPYDPAAVRSTMGAIFSQRFVRISIAAFKRWKQHHRCMLVGTSPSAPHDYHAVTYQRPTLLLMGEERKGLPQELQALCDIMVRIPMVGETDSLNLAIATGIMVYELFNQSRLNNNPC